MSITDRMHAVHLLTEKQGSDTKRFSKEFYMKLFSELSERKGFPKNTLNRSSTKAQKATFAVALA